ncbi:MAG: sn-glycerol-3-phosphate ABC transporter ATP-binding protein UgpC [Acidimicrobiaceae bacterium]|nr:sn-glycerol-3-phosphate ABC transporter ATP-binding protein UgpC [Acidimicrobiaceae bacterium]MDE0492950.1 sn-glycerol-3-phosphate ABC transporter ATP-binding protein UgpC [Acidimicrobiaceae bacterium]MXW89039.1 sn-glycerol-3-phosphate ABC transporter ATP-binding protein UgpC [Acidimicrobiaceae bacterium]MXY11594.1 sn-glycerol-3-phosphate ABC transporter ATP-binding protein UgpC [Acidimicrobiaceae bacterium]MXZ64466.1 sn-glycerol-3-phosphate ABC transporter ATP-binding protein UgpC [Acidimic
MSTVTLKNLVKDYPNGFRAITDLSLHLDDGEFLVLVGPSGCGKSTALRMIAGLEDITSGDLYVGDRRLNDVAPKDRDMAMVFQNYALYPQMTVAENIAFPLKLRRVPKAERTAQVLQAAEILELTEQLDKKPAHLSGGQRQRVAMGRAIVRHPALFLMDEPLSNLDAKLRVQMRADIAGIQRELGVTTFYVTHDQVEAMTMGDRVAVIKDGVLQQVDTPESIYGSPDNVFVAAFIGSPSMNLFEASLTGSDEPDGGYSLALGDQRLAVPAEVVADRPSLASYEGRPVVVGIRPEHLEDASVAPDHPDDQRLDATVDVREALGAETLVHFNLNAQSVDSGDPDALDDLRDTGRCTARFSASSQARVSDQIRVNVDGRKLHFFDRQTHLAIRG